MTVFWFKEPLCFYNWIENLRISGKKCVTSCNENKNFCQNDEANFAFIYLMKEYSLNQFIYL